MYKYLTKTKYTYFTKCKINNSVYRVWSNDLKLIQCSSFHSGYEKKDLKDIINFVGSFSTYKFVNMDNLININITNYIHSPSNMNDLIETIEKYNRPHTKNISILLKYLVANNYEFKHTLVFCDKGMENPLQLTVDNTPPCVINVTDLPKLLQTLCEIREV